jgi:hypothetical protein
MEIVGEVNVLEIQQHEAATEANVRLGGYRMDECCPTSEFKCCRVRLEHGDLDRLFVLGDFAKYTKGKSCRLQDVTQDAEKLEKVASFMHGDGRRGSVDLCSATGLELLIVCRELQDAPLIIYDGCHRAIAQYLKYRSMSGVPAYVCVHPAIDLWGYVPPQARQP